MPSYIPVKPLAQISEQILSSRPTTFSLFLMSCRILMCFCSRAFLSILGFEFDANKNDRILKAQS